MNQNVSLLAAFAAGFLSFVSPCVLPLIPGYISFISGASMDEMRGGAVTAPTTSRTQIFLTSLAFVIGFSIVFVAGRRLWMTASCCPRRPQPVRSLLDARMPSCR